MPLSYTPQGFPVYTLETLPVSDTWIDALKTAAEVKPWLLCRYCGASANEVGRKRLQCCRQCAHTGYLDPTRYCSMDCARKDWTRHRIDCEEAVAFRKALHGQPPGFIVWLKKKSRQSNRWSNAIEPTLLGWAIGQAYRWCPINDTREYCFHIEMQQAFSDPRSPVRPLFMEFRPFGSENVEDWGKPADEEYRTRKIGHFSFTINNLEPTRGWIYLDKEPEECLRSLIPYWPYVLAQCALMGDIHPNIAKVRLIALNTAIEQHKNAAAYLEEFICPKFMNRFSMDSSLIDKWMRIMYPVVGAIASLHRPACNTVSESYGHLLAQCRPRGLDGVDREEDEEERIKAWKLVNEGLCENFISDKIWVDSAVYHS